MLAHSRAACVRASCSSGPASSSTLPWRVLTKGVEDEEGELAGALHARRCRQREALEALGAGSHQVADRHKVGLLRVVAAVPAAGRGGATTAWLLGGVHSGLRCTGGTERRTPDPWLACRAAERSQDRPGLLSGSHAVGVEVGSSRLHAVPTVCWGRLWCRCSSRRRPRPPAPPAGWPGPSGRRWRRSAPGHRQTAAAPCRRCAKARAPGSRAAGRAGQPADRASYYFRRLSKGGWRLGSIPGVQFMEWRINKVLC